MPQWWSGRRDERYWLEITNRDDLGLDLNAPQEGHGGQTHHAYALVTEVEMGDLVFHYDTNAKAIRGVSRIAGRPYADRVVWGSLADGTRPYERDGWRVPLEAFTPLSQSLTLDQLRSDKEVLDTILRNLKRDARVVHYPFEVSPKRPLRLAQAYLKKLPAVVVRRYAALQAAATALESNAPPPVQRRELGLDYQAANEETSVAQADPFTFDPALLERANRGHARTQNALAREVAARGHSPRRPAPDEPNFDLAWDDGRLLWVAEVKSLTAANEEKQLRLGVGQVLRYRQLLARADRTVVAVLAAEREPRDERWLVLCTELGIRLVWPGTFQTLLHPSPIVTA